MSWVILFLIFLILLIVLLLLGQWVPFGLCSVGIIGLYFTGLDKAFLGLQQIPWNTVNSFELTALPLFIFMGSYVMRSGLSSSFYTGMSKLIYWLPGKLLQTNIVACAFFAAISGSSVATAAAIGNVALPELKKRKYDGGMTLGTVTAGGVLGILIPPSIPMIIYGAMVEESVAKLFMAGFIPGILLSLLFMIYIAIRTKLNIKLLPTMDKKGYTFKEKLFGLLNIAPMIMLIVIILGSIYAGIATPTEAAAVAAIAAVAMSVLLKKFKFSFILESLKEAVKTSCMILLIMVGAAVLSYMLVITGVNRNLVEWVIKSNFSPMSFILVMVIIYTVLGCLMEGLAMITLTVPILYPIVIAFGFDPIWFGIFLVILIELAQITPPMGLNLFVMQNISKESMVTVIKSVVPYFLLIYVLLVIIVKYPSIVLWLPKVLTP